MSFRNKIMSLLVTIAVIILLVPSMSQLVVAETNTGTQASGIVAQDTVWKKENSPYILEGDLELAYGKTLTIEPGTTVKGWGSIKVWGDLKVLGTAEDKVFFENVRIIPLGKYNELSSITMQHAYMYGGGVLYWNTSNPQTSFHITDSMFQNTGTMNIVFPKAPSTIERNIFSNTGGIEMVVDKHQQLTVRHNLFYKTSYSRYLVESRVIVSEETIFEKNSFIDIPKVFNLKDSSFSYDLDARNNYWGTSEPIDFAAKFYDQNDSLASPGKVLYEPYLTEADPSTPTVDDILPIPPTVMNAQEFHDGLDMLAGKAEPGTTVYIQNSQEVLGQGKVDAQGSFTLTFAPQPAGTLLKLYAEAPNGKKSMQSTLMVNATPTYPPAMPTVTEPVTVTEKTTQLKGQTEPRVNVYVRNVGQVVGQGKTDLSGTYTIDIAPQPAWSQLEITAVDSKGLTSQIRTISVADITKPSVPVVNPVINSDTKVTGTGEPNSTIKIRISGEVDTFVEGKVDSTGRFEIPIEKQRPMVFLFVHAEDKAGNKSEETFLAVTDGVAPVWSTSAPIKIEDISYDFVAFSWPSATDDVSTSKNITYRVLLNGLPYLGWTFDKPYYKLNIIEEDKPYTLELIAADEQGNTSEPKTISFKSLKRPWDFSDVIQYKDEINYLAAKAIITGYPDHTFKPENQIKRLQAVQMILREKGIDVEKATIKDPQLTDMKPGDYGYKEVAIAVQMGFISGKTNLATGKKYFDPWTTLTRAQMAKILASAYKLSPSSEKVIFDDVPYEFWGRPFINSLYTSGITTGYPDGTFKPNLSISRQHFSLFLARYLNEDF